MKSDFENERQKLIKAHEKAVDDIHNKSHIQIMEIKISYIYDGEAFKYVKKIKRTSLFFSTNLFFDLCVYDLTNVPRLSTSVTFSCGRLCDEWLAAAAVWP